MLKKGEMELFMPFIAIHRKTRKRVDISTIEHPRLNLEKGMYICQLCEQDMFIKEGA